VLKGDNGPIFRVAFSRDGRQIATGGRAGIAQVWESATPEQVAAWTAEETRIN
jgi:WD40 repeat protein